MTKDEIEKYYNVLPHGVIISKRLNRVMGGKIDKYGYRIIALSLDGKPVKHVGMHRIVATCYLPNPDNLPQVNHKDGDKLNNRVTNLEWCDGFHNMQHAYANGLIAAWNKGKTGVYSVHGIEAMKLSQPNRKPVIVLKDGIEVAKYNSVRDLSVQMNLDRRTCMRVLKGEKSFNTIQGYKLIYGLNS